MLIIFLCKHCPLLMDEATMKVHKEDSPKNKGASM
jgi:hypothetical protein